MQNETTSAKERNKQIFVLAVAINEYESEKVSNLKGCVKDVEDLEKMLKEQYAIPEENYLVLKNEQATRANIIDSFRSHFVKLQAGDTAVFHYSGHGSWEDGSKEFVEASLEEAGNRNELLVVQNYGQEGVFNIADKELRWLIHELQFAEDQTPKNINFIGLMDCCFSGSLFRDTEKRSRITLPDNNQERGLKDYLEGQYQQLHETTGLKFPAVNFITFSACSPKESALEDNKGGLFTQALVTVLSQSKQELPSYADLHSRLKYKIEEGSGEAQHPFLEYEGKVNPYQSFLSQEVKAAQLLPPLIKKKEKWFTPVGAIHGIYESSWRKTEIQLYASNNLTTAIGTAKLETIGIEECTLKPTFFNPAQASEEVVVGIYGDQLELSLRVETDMQSVADELVQKWGKSALNRQIRVLDQAKYQLKFDDSSISIYKEDQLLVGGKWDALAEEATADKETVIDFINHSVQQIIRWERILHIQTPKRSKLDVEGIDIQFSYEYYGDESQDQKSVWIAPTHSEEESVSEVNIPISSKDQFITYQVQLTNNSKAFKPLYFYLVQLGDDYGITQLFPNYNKKLGWQETRTYDSLEEEEGLTLNHRIAVGLDRMSQHFAVIAYDAPRGEAGLSVPYFFDHKGFGDFFGKMNDAQDLRSKKGNSKLPKKDLPARWQVKRFRVHLELVKVDS